MATPDEAETSSATSHVSAETGGVQKPLRRACDCCRKRKVRCDGGSPCGPCTKASINCAYLQPPKKKGPKGLRSARVLHALRRIDEHASNNPVTPISPDQPGAFGNWGWSQPSVSPTGVQYAPNIQQQQDVVYGPHTSVPPEQAYFQQPMPTSMPTTAIPPMIYGPDPSTQAWPPESLAGDSDIPSMLSPPISEPVQLRQPAKGFLPYMRLFFDYMFVIMPVIDRDIYGDPSFYHNSNAWSSEVYCFVCAVCAAVIVQLQAQKIDLPFHGPEIEMDKLFAEECLREQKTFDYIAKPTKLSVMTSFFLFAYYGNHENPCKAWHYLQETISFAEILDMDDERMYEKLDHIEAQWTRRLYWLLFITERAYAIQRRKHARLPHTVMQPSVFPDEPPEMLNGFNNLGKLFSAIDDNFVRAWRGSRKASLCNEAWLAHTQDRIDKVAFDLWGSGNETQQMDINVTREWLHVLAWQMGVTHGVVLWGNKDNPMGLSYPIELAKKVVDYTSTANALALDSHGIGMEQKLSDIANCLADVLKATTDVTSIKWLEGKHYLTTLLGKLQTIRGGESRYLKPLLNRIQGLTQPEFLHGQDLRAEIPLPDAYAHALLDANGWGSDYDFPGFSGMGPTSAGTYDSHHSAILAENTKNAFLHSNAYNSGRLSPARSMTDSVSMLRSLSMNGGNPFGMSMPVLEWENRPFGPGVQAAVWADGVGQRRESGFVEEVGEVKVEVDGVDWDGWGIGGLPQAV